MPLQFPAGGSADSLDLDGTESFDITGITTLNQGVTPKTLTVVATKADGSQVAFDAVVCIGTPGEADYYRHDGVLHCMLRNLVTTQVEIAVVFVATLAALLTLVSAS